MEVVRSPLFQAVGYRGDDTLHQTELRPGKRPPPQVHGSAESDGAGLAGKPLCMRVLALSARLEVMTRHVLTDAKRIFDTVQFLYYDR